ncbi:NAD(P)/FAD-dependent oxidoreductase [Paenibacillus flagellatus]|uniref:FAD-dependent oxidoreductase n=1 Tax=Paenibacillus flagellatus TaxID=2211139 RepID=A0A2V5KTU4_9BACL|nr:NAD(P)/FAD-dependent oxidoreductase [Paenibacillus flagellatus]PYI55247.1 FAD-dependent oxidoreductase [Paenibacillus flagellatus]
MTHTPIASKNGTPRIVVLGAGYGGIVTVQRLQKLLRPGEASVTLVSKHDYHYVTAHLHMPAAGTDRLESARVSIASLIDPKRTRFVRSAVRRIDPKRRVVELESGTLEYDVLVVGLGGEPETFGIPGVAEHAMNIRSLNTVRRIREHIEMSFETFKREPHRTELLTFVVVGAGFTGTEFVGELADRLPVLCKKYGVDPSLVKLYNIEASPTALPPGFPPELVRYGMNVLSRKGVVYKLASPIRECRPDGVLLNGGEFIPAGTVVWAGGVRGNRLLEEAGFETSRGQVAVDLYLRSPQFANVYVIGDCSLVVGLDGKRVPSTGQLAVQQGAYLARCLAASVRGEKAEPFVYRHQGTVASLGKGAAVGVVGSRILYGYVASLLKKLIDMRYLYLIGGIPLVLRKGVFKTD